MAAGPSRPLPGTRVEPLTVSQLNELADQVLGNEFGAVWVAGEISRFLAHRSGHWYFTLKDDKAAVSAAMFRSRNALVRFEPRDGLEVLCLARPAIYVPQGRYQVIVESMEPRGRGARALALEQLRARLAAEGLFDAERKRPLPVLPRRIGVVTSPDGAALRDVLRVLRRRFAGVTVLVVPAQVQGEGAPESIVEALRAADRAGTDVILLVRGGGAREDLEAFDDERVVRAVAACKTPIVSGVGHEIDTTLADLAADVRAATPSAAAELVVRERQQLVDRVAALRVALARAMRHALDRRRGRLAELAGARGLGRVPGRIHRAELETAELLRRAERAQRTRLRSLRERLERASRRLRPESWLGRLGRWRERCRGLAIRAREAHRSRLAAARGRLERARARLGALSPLAVLERGYVLVTAGGPEGPVIDDPHRLRRGEEVHLRWARGAASARVLDLFLPADRGDAGRKEDP
ncbi:MAG: exodeoxyribonuclease VII large subunit [Acidobacteria bacterium]|nr:MAG: exodeoxyribonuclease VII large subunit [Acidobacteriota bacterium]